ncbi:MAG: AAA family ATPase [Dethiobacter sp.]|jgi:vesicle-fusing ATPase|nr:AAA family ATPase [Dethiobacter sp.]
MIIEIALGAGAAVLVVLIWQGVNIAPMVFFGALIYLLYHFAGVKGGNKKFAVVESGSTTGLVKFKQIGGQQTAKKELLEALDFIRYPERVASMGIRPLKGILLVGPPGTGKTLLAKAAAQYTDSIFMSSSGSEFIEMYAGVGAQRVRQLFEKARSLAQKGKKKSAIIFIDEIEILGGKRGSHSSHHEYDQTLNQLLVEMDGMALDQSVRTLVIGATNRADILDGALIRPGRFDRIVQVDLPDVDARHEILRLHTENKPLSECTDLQKIARETFGFSGAHLESVANEAAILAMRDEAEKITQRYFADAIDKVIMGEKLERKPDSSELWRVAVHEIGHALISETIRPGSVSTVTTTSRGKALGYMRQMPEKDSYIYTREYIEGQISIMLGGAVAEEVVFGDRSTGAANDFQQAVDAAKKIIAAGMSQLGVVSLEDVPGRTVHRVIQKIIAAQEDRVRLLLVPQIELIKEVADILVVQEKVSGELLRESLKAAQEKAAC